MYAFAQHSQIAAPMVMFPPRGGRDYSNRDPL